MHICAIHNLLHSHAIFSCSRISRKVCDSVWV
jgi:hypothetical protein